MRSRVDPDQRPGDPTIGVGQSPHRAASAVRTPWTGRTGRPTMWRPMVVSHPPPSDRSGEVDHRRSPGVEDCPVLSRTARTNPPLIRIIPLCQSKYATPSPKVSMTWTHTPFFWRDFIISVESGISHARGAAGRQPWLVSNSRSRQRSSS